MRLYIQILSEFGCFQIKEGEIFENSVQRNCRIKIIFCVWGDFNGLLGGCDVWHNGAPSGRSTKFGSASRRFSSAPSLLVCFLIVFFFILYSQTLTHFLLTKVEGRNLRLLYPVECFFVPAKFKKFFHSGLSFCMSTIRVQFVVFLATPSFSYHSDLWEKLISI